MNRYSHYRSKLAKSRIARLFTTHFRNVDKKTLAKNIALSGIALFLLGSLFTLAAYFWYSRDLPDPNTLLTRNVELSTEIYDRTGEHLLYVIAADENRRLVTLDEIPDYMEKAVISAEDANFYEHHGFSIKGLARAAIFMGKRGGGSTITQQLVKNAILNNERSLTRKFKEIILSIAIEQNFTKDQILQMYFNEIGYGGRNYGIESAAKEYYGKHASELTLAEAATLAGLPQLPSYYLNHPDELQGRRDWILGRMVELGYISQEEADAAKAQELGIINNEDEIIAPHFVLWVKEQLVEMFNGDERKVEEGGLKVITTLDYDKQTLAENAVTAGVSARGATYNFNNAGLLAMDPKTGQVLAMVGSVDYYNDEIQGQVNVTQRPLQPGSSFKPIVYAAAFEKGYTPNTLVWDVHTTFPTATGNYQPYNYNVSLESGPISLRKALQGSLNIPAVKTLYLVGVDRALDFAERLGYTTFEDRSDFGLAIVLGGAEVKMVDHAQAYSVFANQGKKQDVAAILKVEDKDKNTVYEWKAEEHQGEQVIESTIAATITNVLADNNARAYVFGTNSSLQLGARPVAAKTGTTNDYNDAWTMGYTPSLVAGVWVGNTDGSEMKRGADGSIIAAPIWNEFMRNALEGTPIEAFPAASIPDTGKAVLDGELVTETVTIDTASGKLATERTPERFRKEVTCGEFHTILHYVNKDDPRGAAPSNPENDPYYDDWEKAIQEWITERNASLEEGETAYEACEVPDEEDDIHTEENEPEIDIRTPDNGDNVGREFEVRYSIETEFDFNRVEFSVDGKYVATSEDDDEASLDLPSWVRRGEHTLTATVYDEYDNTASDEIRIDVSETSAGSMDDLRISNPFENQTIEKTSATYTISIEVPNAEEANMLTLYARNLWTRESVYIGEVSSPSSITSLSWTLPDEGRYAVWASASYDDGSTIQSESVRVSVREQRTASSGSGISVLDLEAPPIVTP